MVWIGEPGRGYARRARGDRTYPHRLTAVGTAAGPPRTIVAERHADFVLRDQIRALESTATIWVRFDGGMVVTGIALADAPH